MVKTKHGILARMLAAYARDAEPEEVAEAVEAIDDIVSENPEEEVKAKDGNGEVLEKLDTVIDELQTRLPGKTEEDADETLPEEEEKVTTDGDKLDTVIELLTKLVEKQAADCKDEAPEEVDPLKKLEDDLDAIEGKKDEELPVEEDEDEEEPEEGDEDFAPDEDPAEPESHFVDPEEINEDDDEEVVAAEAEKKPVGVDRRACDAMRAAIKAVKPVIAQLPPSERKAAADAAVKSIRQSYGMPAKATKNDYLALRRRKAADRAARDDDAELARKIMKARNANYKK